MYLRRKTPRNYLLLPLARQIESAFAAARERNFRIVQTIRLIISGLFLLTIAITEVINKPPLLDYLLLYGAGLIYLVINIIAKRLFHISRRYRLLAGYIIPILEIILLSASVCIANPAGSYLIFFGAENILFVLILILISLHGDYWQVISACVLVAISHLLLSLAVYNNYKIFHLDPTALHFVNTEEMIWFSVYLAICGWVLSYKAKEIDALDQDMRNIWIPRIISGAYSNLFDGNSSYDFSSYRIHSKATFAEKYVGADFVKVKNHGKDILVLIGDVVSHGINVSQGATVCMSAFNAVESRDPKKILMILNRVLLDIEKDNGGETLAICLRLRPDGTVIYNGFLDKFSVTRNGVEVDIPTTGKLLGKDPNYEPHENGILKLNAGDYLSILTDGASNADNNDDQTTVVVTYNGLPHSSFS